MKICDDWADLIEYVIQRFIATMGDRSDSNMKYIYRIPVLWEIKCDKRVFPFQATRLRRQPLGLSRESN